MASQGAIVYAAINLLNDKMYIGATEKGLRPRQMKHVSNARRGQLSKFYTAIRKHGADRFKFLVIQKCADFWDALEHERRLIEWLKPEYNMTDGGGGVKGLKFSAESRKKMSDAKIGKPGVWSRTRMPDDMRERLAAARRAEVGRKITDLNRLRQMRIVTTAMNERRRKRVIALHDGGREFKSVTEAATAYGLTTGAISYLCKGKHHSRRGLRFQYVGANQ